MKNAILSLYLDFLFWRFERASSKYRKTVQKFYSACSIRDAIDFKTEDTEIFVAHLDRVISELKDLKESLNKKIVKIDLKIENIELGISSVG